MKAEDIREWDNVEIRARLGELREERFRLRFQTGTMQLENPKMLQHIRRDVARLTQFFGSESFPRSPPRPLYRMRRRRRPPRRLCRPRRENRAE